MSTESLTLEEKRLILSVLQSMESVLNAAGYQKPAHEQTKFLEVLRLIGPIDA